MNVIKLIKLANEFEKYSKIKISSTISDENDCFSLSKKEALHILERERDDKSNYLPNKQSREVLLDNGAKLVYNPNHPLASENEPYIIYGYDPGSEKYSEIWGKYPSVYEYYQMLKRREEDEWESSLHEQIINPQYEQEVARKKDPDMAHTSEISNEQAETLLKHHNKQTSKNNELPSENEKIVLWNGVELIKKYQTFFIKSTDEKKRHDTDKISHIGTHKGHTADGGNFIKWVKNDLTISVEKSKSYWGENQNYEIKITNNQDNTYFKYEIQNDQMTLLNSSNNELPYVNFNGDKVSIRYLDQKFSFKLSNLGF